MNGDSGVRKQPPKPASFFHILNNIHYIILMNEFKFFKGEIIDPFQSVPENYRVESVDSIYYNPLTFIPTRRVYCRHIIDTDDIFSFPITDTHWLWDYNDGNNQHNTQ